MEMRSRVAMATTGLRNGDDQLYGEAGNDQIRGGNGNDFIRWGSGNDKIRGDSGTDVLLGESGNDGRRILHPFPPTTTRTTVKQKLIP